MASNCLSWPQIASIGLKLPQLASNCLSWPQIASSGLKLPQLASAGLNCHQLTRGITVIFTLYKHFIRCRPFPLNISSILNTPNKHQLRPVEASCGQFRPAKAS